MNSGLLIYCLRPAIMLTRLLTLACVSIALVTQDPSTTPQDEAVAPQAETKPVDPNAWQLAEKWEGLLGAWQLMQFDPATTSIPPESVRGTMIIQEGFMSLVIHAYSFEEEDEPMGQAGIHRWHVTEEDVLQTANSIGHSNMGQDFAWEPVNIPREFRMVLDENNLVLTRPDNSRLVFRRMAPMKYPAAATARIQAMRAGFDD